MKQSNDKDGLRDKIETELLKCMVDKKDIEETVEDIVEQITIHFEKKYKELYEKRMLSEDEIYQLLSATVALDSYDLELKPRIAKAIHKAPVERIRREE
jgi:hypothetical protein